MNRIERLLSDKMFLLYEGILIISIVVCLLQVSLILWGCLMSVATFIFGYNQGRNRASNHKDSTVEG
jgi:hypothetical protein